MVILFFYIMLSWNGKEVVYAQWVFYVAISIVFIKIIHTNNKYCSAKCYRAQKEFFGTLAQVP
jgi:hypothetical protein